MLENLLTIDVEDWFHILDAPRSDTAKIPWDTLPSRVVANTERILAILDNHGVTATFFVLGWVAKHHPSLIRRIAECGHDIASHGYGHILVNRVSPSTFEADLIRSLGTIGNAVGRAVIGYRASGFSVTPNTPWAFPILAKHGIQYDASIFPAVHAHGGFPNAPKRPFLLQTTCGHKLYEFPASVVRLFGRSLPIGGGGYLRLLPTPVIHGAIRYLNHIGENATIYLHPREIDPLQPRLSGLPFHRRFKYYVNLSGTEHKLNELLSCFRFTSIQRILEFDDYRRCIAQKRFTVDGTC